MGDAGISVVVPVHDAETTLTEAVDALLAQELDHLWELLLVDNGSRDGSRELARSYAASDPRVRALDASTRRGAPHAMNVGAAHARWERIAFTDADDVVAAGWLQAIHAALDGHLAVTGRLELDRLNPRALADSRGRAYADGLQTFDGIFPVVRTGNMGISRETLTRVGGWDERFLVGYDVDLSLRLWRAGVAVAFSDDAVLHYRYRSGLRQLWSQGREYGANVVRVRQRLREQVLRIPRFRRWRNLGWLPRHLPDLVDPAARPRWVWVAANLAGEVEGVARPARTRRQRR